MIPFKNNVPVRVHHKQSHISDGSVKKKTPKKKQNQKVLNNTMYTKTSYMRFQRVI